MAGALAVISVLLFSLAFLCPIGGAASAWRCGTGSRSIT
jgi:hypothetical protein